MTVKETIESTSSEKEANTSREEVLTCDLHEMTGGQVTGSQ